MFKLAKVIINHRFHGGDNNRQKNIKIQNN